MTSDTETPPSPEAPSPEATPKPPGQPGRDAPSAEHPVDTKVQEDAAKDRAESGGYD